MKASKTQWNQVETVAEASVLRAIEESESPLVYLPRLVRPLRHLGLAEVKRALLSLCRKQVLCLHGHDAPWMMSVSERQHCLRINAGQETRYFHGVAIA